MIIVDVETTGTSPNAHSLASIGAIDFDNPKDQFHGECKIWPGAHIDKEALAINGYTQEELMDIKKMTEGELVKSFLNWAKDRKNHTLAGQNPFFDTAFIQAGAARNHIDFPLAHRIVDLHSIAYFHMILHGIKPPTQHSRSAIDSDTIMAYVGIPAEPKPHIALNGAKWEAEAFHRLFSNKPLFGEFKKFRVPWIKNEKNSKI